MRRVDNIAGPFRLFACTEVAACREVLLGKENLQKAATAISNPLNVVNHISGDAPLSALV